MNKLSKYVRKIDAIDISKGMIRVAKKQAEDNSISTIKYTQTSIFDERLEEKLLTLHNPSMFCTT